MSNGAVRRYGGRALQGALLAVLLTALPPYRPSALLAQGVGHDPDASPFRDITTRQSVTFLTGEFFGNKALAGVGAQAAPTFGFRFRNQLSGPLALSVGFNLINSKRIVINPSKPDSIRRTGPVDYGMITADLQLLLALTGGKTWHRMAPWLGFGFGIENATHPVTDPGGYRAGLNFTFVPSVGMDLHLSPKVGLTFEARDNTIRYEWPLSYFAPTDSTGKALPPVLDPNTVKDKQLTHNFTLSVGLTYRFNF